MMPTTSVVTTLVHATAFGWPVFLSLRTRVVEIPEPEPTRV